MLLVLIWEVRDASHSHRQCWDDRLQISLHMPGLATVQNVQGAIRQGSSEPANIRRLSGLEHVEWYLQDNQAATYQAHEWMAEVKCLLQRYVSLLNFRVHDQLVQSVCSGWTNIDGRCGTVRQSPLNAAGLRRAGGLRIAEVCRSL